MRASISISLHSFLVAEHSDQGFVHRSHHKRLQSKSCKDQNRKRPQDPFYYAPSSRFCNCGPFSVPYFPWLFSVPLPRALFPCRTIAGGSVTRRLTMNTMLHCGLAQDVTSSKFKIGINAIVNNVDININTTLHC